MVAWVALAVSLLSLGWQIISWVRSGARIIVKSADEFIFAEPKRRRIVVVVTNVGRMATTVQQVGLKASNTAVKQGKVMPSDVSVGPGERDELPKRLEAGEELIIRFDGPDMQDYVAAGIESSDFVPYARSAGRKLTTGRYSPNEKRVDFTQEKSAR
ncbi:hypothetical protein [Saccharothrix deserti]|uniref:hypothetical protein n=1 Tax=Saccharothrix deserti TaxID=2593674 RepID=UPI00131B1C70|nr:hypothetical protein [Saccharothrix deserti]